MKSNLVLSKTGLSLHKPGQKIATQSPLTLTRLLQELTLLQILISTKE